MNAAQNISLFNAVLININIMIGTGLFINTTELAKKAGSLGIFSYGLVAILLLPLVLSMASLLKHFPGGNFYIFGAHAIHPFAGFINSWNYFFAKLGSATLAIHTFTSIINQAIPPLNFVSIYIWDCLIISLFIFLNTRKIKTGTMIQRYLILSKIIPISCVIIVGIFYTTSDQLIKITPSWDSTTSTIPLVLFSLLGFEAICSLNANIALSNNRNTGAHAVLYSYTIVALIYMLYQGLFYKIVGSNFTFLNTYQDAFPALFKACFSSPYTINTVSNFIYILIGTSALSGAYGIFFANQWNLSTIAQAKTFTGSFLFNQYNQWHVPYTCTIAQGLVCFLYLYITNGQQIILQQLAALGSTITYTICVIALLYKTETSVEKIIGFAGLGSCMLLIAACIKNFLHNGIGTLSLYAIILAVGSILFCINHIHNKKHHGGY